MSKKNKKDIANWILVIFWMAIIFFLSNQPHLKSGFMPLWDFILRKFAHVFEYAVLTFLLMKAFNGYNLSKKKKIVLAIVIAILYSVSDEYHQTFVLGRVGSIFDVLIDSIGIFLSAWLHKRKMIK